MMRDELQVRVKGHLLIRDSVTGEVLVDKCNAIHPQNLAQTFARGLARDANGYLFKLSFGNGGTFYNSSSQIVYRPPNVVGNADLYNVTYEVQIDDQSAGTPSTNSVVSSPSPSPAITSLVTATAQLNANEPAGQGIADNVTTNLLAPFIFDEAGLKTPDGLLLSHIVFSPFEKAANRAIQIIYDLTISVS